MDDSVSTLCAAHNTFVIDTLTFSSDFDNGNLLKIEKLYRNVTNGSSIQLHEYKIWTANDNHGSRYQSKNYSGWFHYFVKGQENLTPCMIRFIVMTPSHQNLYRHDMRPVYKAKSTGYQWTRIKTGVRYIKASEVDGLSLISSSNQPSMYMYFEHHIESKEDSQIYFAFTYPYTYTMIQQDLDIFLPCTQPKIKNTPIDGSSIVSLEIIDDENILCHRELLTYSCDGRRIDLVTITSQSQEETIESNDDIKFGHISQESIDPALNDLFPEIRKLQGPIKPTIINNKQVIFISARVHPGEVPSQYTLRGIMNFLLDKSDIRAKRLRQLYIFKIIPMLNPDGVFRGHFRADQHGQNLNRHYSNPDKLLQPSIYAAKRLLDYYAKLQRLVLYLDLHAHSSKRGCFIYGNVMDSMNDQIQNQLFCKLIALNTPYFDYENCLFSRDHMYRIDPGDQAEGLTAEGSGRVSNYLAYGLVHSYTLECNYNTSKTTNEVPPLECDPKSDPRYASLNLLYGSPSNPLPDKYTPSSYASVGIACIIAILDIRGHNPCSRIPKSKYRTIDKLYSSICTEVRQRKEYRNINGSLQSIGKISSDSPALPRRGIQGISLKAHSRRRKNTQDLNIINSFEWQRVVSLPDTVSLDSKQIKQIIKDEDDSNSDDLNVERDDIESISKYAAIDDETTLTTHSDESYIHSTHQPMLSISKLSINQGLSPDRGDSVIGDSSSEKSPCGNHRNKPIERSKSVSSGTRPRSSINISNHNESNILPVIKTDSIPTFLIVGKHPSMKGPDSNMSSISSSPVKLPVYRLDLSNVNNNNKNLSSSNASDTIRGVEDASAVDVTSTNPHIQRNTESPYNIHFSMIQLPTLALKPQTSNESNIESIDKKPRSESMKITVQDIKTPIFSQPLRSKSSGIRNRTKIPTYRLITTKLRSKNTNNDKDIKS